MTAPHDIVVSGIGVLTARGVGIAAHLAALDEARCEAGAAGLGGIDVTRLLSDRRLTKTVSFRDKVGLVALEGAARHCGFAKAAFQPGRVGIYVGSPPGSVLDAEPYAEALRAACGPSGHLDVARFGRECANVQPTALLLGLPNNVLCYGSILMDARGPNSNYTSGSVSGHLAVLNAWRRLERRQLDFALAGGFSVRCDAVHPALLTHTGATGNAGSVQAPLADGSVFVALERRESAVARGARPLVTLMASAVCADAAGPFQVDPSGRVLTAGILRTLAQCGVAPEQVGLVLSSPSLTEPAFASLCTSLERLFPERDGRPALGIMAPFGQLMEASGLLELGALTYLYARGEIPEPAASSRAVALGFPRVVRGDRPYALVVGGSSAGDYTCIVLRRES